MAKIIWTEPALNDLEAIANFIAIENAVAAAELVQRIVDHVEQLKLHPNSGSKPRELENARYRQIIEPPCRIFYRHDGPNVYILYVMRAERLLRKSILVARAQKSEV